MRLSLSAFDIRLELGLLTTDGTKVKLIHPLDCVMLTKNVVTLYFTG